VEDNQSASCHVRPVLADLGVDACRDFAARAGGPYPLITQLRVDLEALAPEQNGDYWRGFDRGLEACDRMAR
jgi:hypothetical protein